jgi:hypothetical protein
MLGEDMSTALQQGRISRDDLRQHLLAIEDIPASARYFRLLEQVHSRVR